MGIKTYVKLYRVLLEHPMLSNDNNAWIVFTKILLRVDWQTGKLVTGRFKMAELTNLNPNTVYATLKRLEKAEIITQAHNNKFTEITVVNWHKYQSDNNNDNIEITTRQQPDNTINNNKRIKEVINTNVADEDCGKLLFSFNSSFERKYRLTEELKKKIKARLKTFTFDELNSAIESCSKSKFHRGENDTKWEAEPIWLFKNDSNVEKFIVKPKPVEKEYKKRTPLGKFGDFVYYTEEELEKHLSDI